MIDIVDLISDFKEFANKYGLEQHIELTEDNTLDGAIVYVRGSKLFAKYVENDIKDMDKLSFL